MDEDFLYVIVPYFNFADYKSGVSNLNRFITQMSTFRQVRTVLIEGYRENQLEDYSNKVFKHIKVKLPSILWVKENLINIAITSLPEKWKYVSWIDRDILFTNTAWVEETIHELKSNDLVQPWTSCIFLDKDFVPSEVTREGEAVVFAESFCSSYPKKVIDLDKWYKAAKSTIGNLTTSVWAGHPGQAWAATRGFYEKLGGLYDRAIVGGADSLILIAKLELKNCCMLTGIATDVQNYLKHLKEAKISCVKGLICHYHHGEIKDRGYADRHKMLKEHNYEPRTFLSYTSEGVLTYTAHGTLLEQSVYNYFKLRKEDGEKYDNKQGY